MIKLYIYLLFFFKVKRIYQAFQCKKPEVFSLPYSRVIKVLSGSTAIFVFENYRHRLFISTMITLTKFTNQLFVLSTCGFFYVKEDRLDYNLVPHILWARSWSVGQVKLKN